MIIEADRLGRNRCQGVISGAFALDTQRLWAVMAAEEELEAAGLGGAAPTCIGIRVPVVTSVVVEKGMGSVEASWRRTGTVRVGISTPRPCCQHGKRDYTPNKAH